MMILISGGSSSGKSEYAEKTACDISKNSDNKRLIYLATMKADCNEAFSRIERHRRKRAGKGFETIEYTEAGKTDGSKEAFLKVTERLDKNCVLLLEDLPNMLACNMYGSLNDSAFEGDLAQTPDVIEVIKKEIEKLEEICDTVVIVSNDIFSDGIIYDESTEKFKQNLSKLNIWIADKTGTVTEVIAGIPIKHEADTRFN